MTTPEVRRTPAGEPASRSPQGMSGSAHGRFVSTMLERSSIGTAVLSADGELALVNPAFCRMLDLDAASLTGRSLVALVHADDAQLAILRVRDLLSGRATAVHERLRFVGRAGDVVHSDVSMSVLDDEDGAPLGYLVQAVDVSTEVANFEVLQRTAHQFRLMAENASDVVYQTDLSGVIRWVSPSVTHVLGWEPSSLVGTHAASLVSPDDLPLVPSRANGFYLGEPATSVIVRFRTLRGEYRDMSVSARPIEAEDGLPGGAVIGLRDVTDEQAARRTLARSEERFRLAMASAPHGMAIADATGAFVQVNPALCELLGVPRAEILGRTIADFLGPDDLHVLRAIDDALVERREDSVSVEHHLLTQHREVWVVHAVSVTRDERGAPLFHVHQFVDQTEARRLRADLEYRASRDGLTGVSNRSELMRRLGRQLATSNAASAGVGVLFVDIDNLKPINDTHGHKAGDDVITGVADRLLRSVRRDDLVARIGGDEFVVVLDGMHSSEEVRRIAEKCREHVAEPVDSDGVQVPVTVSIGAVLALTTETPEHVLIRADQALYRAKQGGRNVVDLG